MTHDQHNEAPNLLQHVSDIFPCHSTYKPSNLRFSSLPTFLSEFVNILPCYSLLSVSCSMFLLYTIVSLLRPSAIIPIIQQSSIRSSSNISFCTIHHSLIHHARISNIDFFFHVKHATTSFPLPNPYSPLHLNLSFFLPPKIFSEPSANYCNYKQPLIILLLCVRVYVFFSSH